MAPSSVKLYITPFIVENKPYDEVLEIDGVHAFTHIPSNYSGGAIDFGFASIAGTKLLQSLMIDKH